MLNYASAGELYSAFVTGGMEVCTDTRKLTKGALFMALRGPNFDANSFAQRAIDEGDFTVPVEAEAITRYLMAVLQGVSVQAGAGASRAELQEVAKATLTLWPGR